MKVYSICYISAQVPYLGKIWFLIYSDCRILKSAVSLEQNVEIACFLHEDTFMKTGSSLKNFGVGAVKNGCYHSGHRTLNLAVSQKQIANFCMLIQIQKS